MFGIEKIDLTFSINPFLLVLFFLIAAGFTFFIYRYTVPVVDLPKKIFLILIRFTALLLMLFIIFEPILTLAKKIVIEPVNLVFIDNSRSIKIDDGTNREETVKNFINDLEGNFEENILEINLFGNNISHPDPDQLNNIDFSDGSTNVSNIFSFIEKQNKTISSVSIISDGVITDGSNPLYSAEKLNVPVFTIGVGDSSKRKDIEIRNVLFNEYIYAETPTIILTTINNIGFGGKEVNTALYEQNILVEQKRIFLSEEGIQNVEFEYKPSASGEKKLTIEVSSLDGEFTKANNKKVFYIDVLDNKINILLLAGSPSSDLSFIKNALATDENFEVNSLTQISSDKFLEKGNPDRLLDSADIIFLVGFPSKETSNNFLNKVQDKIFNKDKPFFLTLSSGIDFGKLNQLQRELPVNISPKSSFYSEIQPGIIGNQTRNPLLQNKMQNAISAWENLPPVFQPDIRITLKPESELIARSKIKNIPTDNPLIVSRKLGNKKSIAVLAKDIWKWKLQTAMKDFDLFDRFIISSVKWLNTTEDQKQVNIKTSKKIYS
ncbi:MAG TPA: vWA domain-containing protein, partial [Ignavibacteriaceae bacterium]|nr:vWA domain-containing protein [Ignavibacteriaceae bacterium]